MMKMKRWLIEQFLPVYLKKEELKEIDRLQKENQELRVHIRELNAYIDGLELGLRAQRRITIHNHTLRGGKVRASDEEPPEEVKA